MWKLCPATTSGPGEPYRLLVGIDYVVGRKNCTILIQNDQSISRSHAVLSVSHPQVNLSQSSSFPVLTLKDTSKYGTFVNDEKLQNGVPRILKSGDRITFGVFGSKYRVEYQPLVVCSSCLNVSQKTILNKNVLQLGGHVVNEWKEGCTHLVMISIKVTVKESYTILLTEGSNKAMKIISMDHDTKILLLYSCSTVKPLTEGGRTICSLICGRSIVKPEYFSEIIKAVQAKQHLPTPESFSPPVDEPSIKNEKIDLSFCPGRKTIFKGKTFVFLTTKQHAKLSPAIKLGGGEAKLITEVEENDDAFLAPDVCVIEVGATNSQASISDVERKWIDSITAILERNKYRTIPEAEIGLAVLFVSTERYCNPQHLLDAGVKPVSSASVVQGPSLSQTAVIDETIMPTGMGDITVYVADTEVDQLIDTCMELTGEKRNKDITLKDQRKNPSQQYITTVKETPATTGALGIGRELPRLNKRCDIDQKKWSYSPSKILEHNKNREKDSQQQLNSIKTYFQVASKKRERNEDGEASVSKYAKKEENSSQASSSIQPVTSLLLENNPERSQKGQCTLDQNINESMSYIDTKRKSVTENEKLEKTATESIAPGTDMSKKRKKLDDSGEDAASLELIFSSQDLDWEENVEGHSENSVKKKRKLENKEQISADSVARRVLQENEQSLPTLNQKQEIKEELPKATPDQFTGDSHLPSRLLLAEFRSLVVSQPRKGGGHTTKTDSSLLNNFKKFKKVAYPGAGQLPRIIGGSDLIAVHARKNSEMEEWLRQEMEEQSHHAREESLADDLFRYDPHVKRR